MWRIDYAAERGAFHGFELGLNVQAVDLGRGATGVFLRLVMQT